MYIRRIHSNLYIAISAVLRLIRVADGIEIKDDDRRFETK